MSESFYKRLEGNTGPTQNSEMAFGKVYMMEVEGKAVAIYLTLGGGAHAR